MRAVVQRVSRACVDIGDRRQSAIEGGLLVYLGVAENDEEADVNLLADKVRHLRIFPDRDDKLNLDVCDSGGGVLVVSAFTVQADARKGCRPSFTRAAAPEQARRLYDDFCRKLASLGVEVRTGVFREFMQIESTNDGPICILLDSRRAF